MLIAITMPVPVSPSDGPGLIGGPSGSPVMLIVPPAGLRDHVEGEVLLVRAALAKAFDLAIDDAGVEGADRVVAEADALDRAGRHVLDHDVGMARHVLDQSQAALGFEVDRDRFLVRIEFEEIIRSRGCPWDRRTRSGRARRPSGFRP